MCDLKSREIPLQLTLDGHADRLDRLALMPWPWPHAVVRSFAVGVNVGRQFAFKTLGVTLNEGIYAWPFWGPLPSWAGEGEWQTGLLTGIIGALVGTFLLRSIGLSFPQRARKEGLGMGDADLMMMAGAFLGWQIIVVAFFLQSFFPPLSLAIILWIIQTTTRCPFGPFLSRERHGNLPRLADRSAQFVRLFSFGRGSVLAGRPWRRAHVFMSFLIRLVKNCDFPAQEPTP